MDEVLLSRIQFALTIGFHFIFPPISIGLAWLLVIIEGMGLRTGDELWLRMGKFFGKLLALTFAVGVATGIVMEFQFGTNWANYSRFVGDIFGAPLAAEGIFAFFLESSFLGLYLFGRNRVSPGVHWFSILMVALGATISAFWILVANSWQQTPAGFTVIEGRAQLTSFAEAVFNPSMWHRFFHTMLATLVAGAFFVGGVASYLVLKKREVDLAARALKLSLVFGFVASVLVIYPSGHEHASQVAHTQPEKFAAIEGLYKGHDSAPLVLFALPSDPPPTLHGLIEIPGLLSWMVFGDVDVPIKGLADFPADEVPQGFELWLSFVSFHNMVILGGLFLGLTGLGLLLIWRKKLLEWSLFLKAMVLAVPLPIFAIELGWIAAEVGRQPWVVYKVLRTQDAASPAVSSGDIMFSIVMFSLIYLMLGALYLFLLFREIKKGPEPASEGVA